MGFNSGFEGLKNPYSGSSIVARGADRWTHKTKLIVAFHNFAKNALKNEQGLTTVTY